MRARVRVMEVWRSGAWRWAALAFGVASLGGCSASPPTTDSPATTTKPQVWGQRGSGPGQFFEPRAIALDPRGFAWIVDSTGRIQQWTQDGRFLKAWIAPSIEKGRPEGVAVLPDGRIVVNDTHYSRVLLYDATGKLLHQFGKYGRQAGGFLLVTGVCVAPDGTLYTSDYGGDFDRISHWTAAGRLLAGWSGHGEEPRQFRRPCGLAISREGDLLVADIANHRIQRLDARSGKYKGVIGVRGRAPGQLTYPYGVAVDGAGRIYTVEYGTHRVQVWSPQGRFLAWWGGPGHGPGQLANPWGLAVNRDGWVYVADTQNHRVQKFRFTGLPGS